ncbi:hypothetical protein TWF106_000380 [Orbilia oligospora]|uniref:Multiple myeloma tumor-associated protein 2-like N-terminal domain-containing protein n=1 Tax=Orbilia oligospora TaxID=2813651 RepID=A0A7C8UK18_ORBOL|nr:hypothetical protein TWF106_000380 [Orbilia oligospora]
MDLLKGPIREGSRGGRDFKWSDVKDSKDREYYLGVSVKAPTGRWQQNRDIQWYSRDQSQTSAEAEALRREQRLEEIRKIKEAENDALSAALGFKVARRVDDGAGGLSQGEVDRAIKEAGAGVDEREETGNEKGIGFGRIGLAALGGAGGGGGGDREVMAGDNSKDNNEVKWRPAPAPSRETDKRDGRDERRRRDDHEKPSRHRHRSRSKDRSPRRHDDRRDRRDHDRRDRDRDDRRRR